VNENQTLHLAQRNARRLAPPVAESFGRAS
jgi:hypothetical protein